MTPGLLSGGFCKSPAESAMGGRGLMSQSNSVKPMGLSTWGGVVGGLSASTYRKASREG